MYPAGHFTLPRPDGPPYVTPERLAIDCLRVGIVFFDAVAKGWDPDRLVNVVMGSNRRLIGVGDDYENSSS